MATAASADTVGRKLVELCKQGKNMEAVKMLYSSDVVSVEGAEMPGMERTQKGIDKIRAKNQWWLDTHQIHSSSVDGPFNHGDDRFAVIFQYDVTANSGPMAGQRMQLKEVGVFTVQGGKIAREEFFYTMG